MSDLDKEPTNPNIPWKQLVTSFKEGGLTAAQYASFGMSPPFSLHLHSPAIMSLQERKLTISFRGDIHLSPHRSHHSGDPCRSTSPRN